MLTAEQRREILGLALLAVAGFLLLSLFPVSLLGSRGEAWFPSGNTMGLVGGTVRTLLWAVLGVGSFFLSGLLAIAAVRVGGWLSRGWTVRMAVLLAGLLVVVPVALHVVGASSSTAGWVGGWLGSPLLAALGWLGAGLLVLVVFLVLSVASLGWNPLRPVGQGVAKGGQTLKRGAVAAGRAVKGRATKGTEPRGRENGGAEERSATPERQAPADARSARGRGKRSRAATAKELLHDPLEPDGVRDRELPPLELLTLSERARREDMERELDRLGDVLVEKLRTFSVESEIGGRTTGPVVTQFEVVPAPGVKVNRIANLDADLALAMKAQTVRIVAPIPGKGAVGVEIPNPEPEVVQLREILESREFRTSRAGLPLALGKDLTGRPYVTDLSRMPHALIAGATGSGKSVCLNTIITSLVCRNTPETLRLLLIDPKMVELSTYADLPHLRHPVVTDPRDAAGVLKWALIEMDRRYNLLSANGVRSVAEFNRRLKDGVPLRRIEPEGPDGDPDRWLYSDGVLPYIVVVVDELADLMMTVQAEIEKPLTILAQKARAIGIHLVVATQRPSVNVITGLIKANFPCRIAFRVASKTDSRTILDQNGADALLGYGDMLFLPPGQGEPVRIQGAYIPTDDTDRLMAWYRHRAEERAAATAEGADAPAGDGAEEDILALVRSVEAQEAVDAMGAEAGPDDRDELFFAAAEACLQQGQGSTSLLQRRLRIGYGRAARIVDQLHDAGILGPPDGSKPREVLLGLDELEAMAEREGS